MVDFNELSGKPVAEKIMTENKIRAEKLADLGHTPTLSLFRIGERPDDIFYERSILRHCERAGITVRQTLLPAGAPEQDMAKLLTAAAEDNTVDAIFFFSPLPKEYNEPALRELIPAAKDVDCLTRASAAAVFCGEKRGFAPCTPAAVMAMLAHYEVPLKGRHAVVLGRSLVVGKPLAMLLLAADATVTICHSKTTDLPSVCRKADILLAAVGQPRLVQSDFLAPGQVVIDVGVNDDPENPGKMCGDVNYAAAKETAAAATPAPGGVGLVTTAILCQHIIEASEQNVR